jgi:aldehyde dehydrogenase (NAD+)
MAIFESSEGGRLVSRNPAKADDVVGEAAVTSAADVEAAAERLRRQRLPDVAERRNALRALASALREAAPELAPLLVREIAKQPLEAEAEVGFAAAICEHYAGLLADEDSAGDVRRRPVPLAAAITPFNFPLSISVMKLAAAYGAGAPSLWKPSPHAVAVSRALAGVLERGLGRVVELVLTDGVESLEAVAREASAVSYTGGEGGARIVWSAVAARPVPMQLELGSCNATIVGDSFATDDALPVLRASCFGYAGQKCSSTRRILAPRGREDEIFETLAATVRADVVGDPSDAVTTVPPVIAPTAADRVLDGVERWRAAGAEVAGGGRGDSSPCAVQPIVARAPADDAAFHVDVFGPAVVVLPYDGFAEALALAGATPYGLFVGLLSHDEGEIAALLDAPPAGIVKVNQTTPGLVPELPSQGWAASGAGPSELGPDPFRIFQRVQTTYPYVVAAQ